MSETHSFYGAPFEDVRYYGIEVEDLVSEDLRKRGYGVPDARAYRIVITWSGREAEALWLPDEGLMGVWWGGVCEWIEAPSAVLGIEAWVAEHV